MNLVDCTIVCLFLWVLVKWYRVPWNFYYTYLIWISFALSLISFQYFQLYRSWRGWKFYLEFFVILRAWGAVIGLLLFYFFIFKISEAYSRAVFLLWIVGTPILLFVCHVVARKVLHYFRSKGKNIRHAVVAGAGDLGIKLAREVESTPWAGIEVVGFFDDKIGPTDKHEVVGKPVLGKISDIREYLMANDVDYVYVALPMRAEKKIFTLLRECRSLGARIYLVPDIYVYSLHHAEIQSLGNMLVLNFNPHTEWKRGFDIIFSTLALLAASPLMLFISILIKLEDKGPVLYRHKRITSAGKTFDCLKFRTMHVGAEEELPRLLDENPELRLEWEKTYKLKNDPRITKIGKFLRKSSLDELPQFFNVLRGEMSVVGARPIVAHELNEFYKESAGRYCSMKPGITGLWQVGRRSNTEDYIDRVKMDDWYVLNYSLWTDIKIIWKTVLAVFKGNGAY
ncbi:MAG: sugar transferase [Desulfopila sp.]|jgi:exopolysaccharide biosynthesis polyprenyl glycosylphosphotransferase|nr:sugar transferase [Desulfopila sp.]